MSYELKVERLLAETPIGREAPEKVAPRADEIDRAGVVTLCDPATLRQEPS